MPRDRKELGPCPKCGHGPVTCSYNSFVDGAERIDSWEHRCRDCSYRKTQAQRAPADSADRASCPYCHRAAP